MYQDNASGSLECQSGLFYGYCTDIRVYLWLSHKKASRDADLEQFTARGILAETEIGFRVTAGVGSGS